MSRALFSLNPDLARLRSEGYFMRIQGSLLVMLEVPYVDAQRQVRFGTLSSALDLAGDRTRKPETHVMNWNGDFPCNADGTRLQGISHAEPNTDLGHGLKARFTFSSKPSDQGYPDYYAKMSTYATIMSGPAAVLQPGLSPRVFRGGDEEDEASVFNYLDTASSRVGIGALAAKLENEVVAIIGLGGTGSYILDFAAKTPVKQIRLFDPDIFLSHNAFRAPGAPTLEELRDADLLLHLVDASNPRFEDQVCQVRAILEELELDTIPELVVFNKIDQLEPLKKRDTIAFLRVRQAMLRYRAISVSAVDRKSLTSLLDELKQRFWPEAD